MVDYYPSMRSLRRTIRPVGYPSVAALTQVDDELIGQREKSAYHGSIPVQLSGQHNKDALISS